MTGFLKIVQNFICSWISLSIFLPNSSNVYAQCTFPSDWDSQQPLPPGCQPEGTLNLSTYTPTGIQEYIMGMLNVLFPFLGIVAVLFIVISGFKMVIQSHNEQKAKEAQKGLTWAIIGLLATILAYAIITSIIKLIYKIV